MDGESAISVAAATRLVTGSIADRLTRIRPVPCALEFRTVGTHALAHAWPPLGEGAPAPTLGHDDTWEDRFVFVSDDGLIEVVSTGLTAVLGLRFLVPAPLIFGDPETRNDGLGADAEIGSDPRPWN